MTGLSRRAAFGAALALAASPARAQATGTIEVIQPWTRAMRAGGTGAGFMTLRNAGPAADRLIAARCPLAGVVELHTHIRDGDVMRMRPIAAIDLPPGREVRLQPGGLHVMLIGLTQALEPGMRVPVTLVLERAGEIEVALVVEAAGARAPGSGAHRH